MSWGILLLALGALITVSVFVAIGWLADNLPEWLALTIIILGVGCGMAVLLFGIVSTNPTEGPSAGLQEIDRRVPITFCVDRKSWCFDAD